ncbi:LapB repeat-containing protein [Listeria ivanovii]|uniref:LapB repeat-containing protein n=1 Tax=Listeria ivanovii TaxID=1638 RepID=UPI0016278C2E|nr:LapB repeat-containing protein [Listeria ivanovii]MBC2254084.1 LapB repeat-containing protein [Listeria ivanovii]
MTIKSTIVKISVCCAMVIVPATQTALPVFAADQTKLTTSQDTVNIPDTAFKTYLNGLLGQPSTANITEAQMNTIKTISLNNLNITDLTGLEYAHNLTVLSINNINDNSYSQVEQLTSLQRLTIMGTDVTSNQIPDLSNLVNLQVLDLSHCKLDDSIFTKINNLPKVLSMDLSYNPKITNIMELKSLPELKSLNIQFCGVHDYRGVEDFPKLTTLSAYGQAVGGSELITSTIKSSVLTFDEENKTLYIPFSIMTERPVNFDGYTPDFLKSTSSRDTYFTMNDQVVDGSRLTITSEGLTVNGISKTDFDNLEKMEYNARVDLSYGSYNAPPNMTIGSYTISSPTYDHYFDIDHSLNIVADQEMSCIEYQSITEEQFLADIHAETDDGSVVTSDFTEKVDFSNPGTYTVTLQSENNAGLKAAPVQVEFIVLAKTAITAEPEITYEIDATKNEAQFLDDVAAKTNDGTVVTSDFKEVVNLAKSGEYIVTLHATNDKQSADPVQVTVKIPEMTTVPGVTPSPDATASVTPKTETSTPNQSATPSVAPKFGQEEVASADSASPDLKATTKSKADITKSEKVTSKTIKAQEKAEIKTNKAKKDLPKTGDSLPLQSVTIGLLLVAISLLISRKK